MREFFQDWRRKVGSVTLMLTVVVMGAWLRSQGVADEFVIRAGAGTNHWLISSGESLKWVRCQEQPGGWTYTGRSRWESQVIDQSADTDSYSPYFGGVKTHWYWKTPIFQSGKGMFCGSIRTTIWQIPHWAFVWPMTLLSGYLILWKPRKRAP